VEGPAAFTRSREPGVLKVLIASQITDSGSKS
jgi:hypothetical protein